MIEHPCPSCGSTGPHAVIEDSDPERHSLLVECRDCYIEFAVEIL